MAGRGTSRASARRRPGRGYVRFLPRALAAILLIGTIGGGWFWWDMRHWTPPHSEFPAQGVEIGEADGTINWRSIKAIGARFAYIDASASAFARDPLFVANLKGAREAGIEAGAVHRYDPCQPAEKQAANFVTTVPRDARLLPPVVELGILADNCPIKVSEAKVESELITFLNQVETHAGQAVILKILPEFQQRYAIAAKIDRNIWLVRDRWQPEYAGRPWTLWTANSALANEVAADDLRWVAMQP